MIANLARFTTMAVACLLSFALAMSGCATAATQAGSPAHVPTSARVVAPAKGAISLPAQRADRNATASTNGSTRSIVIPDGTKISQSALLPTAREAATPSKKPRLRPGNATVPQPAPSHDLTTPQAAGQQPAVAVCWLPLVQRLAADGLNDPLIAGYFIGLAEYSAAPMGVKVKEMFTNAFVRRPPSKKPAPPRIPPKARIYKNIVTQANMEKCALFLQEHKKAFGAVEKKYTVPKEIIAALIYVETRLGGYIGKENAFWSLACMAAADAPERVTEGVADLPLTTDHDAWLRGKLTEKSRWAYAELKALLAYCRARNLDPHGMPGSVYGAIGLCQFMPSNLIPYGDDGDGDGAVNLFAEPDAIFSVAKYLTGHGWKATPTVDSQRAILKRYNNLTTYANTILTLAESLRTGVPQLAPPDVSPEELAAVLKAQSAKPASKASVKPAPTTKAKAAVKKTVQKTAPKAKAKKAAKKKR